MTTDEDVARINVARIRAELEHNLRRWVSSGFDRDVDLLLLESLETHATKLMRDAHRLNDAATASVLAGVLAEIHDIMRELATSGDEG